MTVSDTDIMLEVQQGRFDRFDELVQRYRTSLVRVAASKLGDRELAEDVVQEVFLAVFSSRHTFRPRYAFRTWIWTILLNLCRRRMKQNRRKPQELVRSSIGAGADDPMTADDGFADLLASERRQQVNALLAGLPAVQADALRLRFFGGLQYDEIAETMGCSTSGAKRRVRNALGALARQLRRE